MLDLLNGEITDSKGNTYAVSTVEKHLSYFNTVFNYAIGMELTDSNPIEKVEFKKDFKKKNRRNFIMTSVDFIDFLKLFEGEQWYIIGIIKMLWCTGMRIGEVLNLKWSCVTLDPGIIILDASSVKEGKIRTIALEDDAIDVLTSIKAVNDKRGANSKTHVFSVTGDKPLTYQAWWKNYRRIVKDSSKFGHFVSHDQRHSWSTRYRREEGADKEVIKRQLGHSTDSMYNYYNDIAQEELIAMVRSKKNT